MTLRQALSCLAPGRNCTIWTRTTCESLERESEYVCKIVIASDMKARA
jgi:hypothetical protein